MVFEVDTFLINPVVEEFGKLKRSELLVLARYFELEVESSMRKQEIKKHFDRVFSRNKYLLMNQLWI